MRTLAHYVCWTLLLAATASPIAAIDAGKAAEYFAEAEALCTKDHGALWGKSLCGPILFVDPQSRQVVSNQETPALEKSGAVWIGQLPADVPVANTSPKWLDRRWTMVLWPLPEDRFDRESLMMHEAWHRIQDDLNLPSSSPTNAQLDTMEGRMWLRLEWVALRRAVESEGDEQRFHVQRAVTFRSHRRELFPGSAREENLLEMHEGIAEDTGFVLAAANDEERKAKTLEQIEEHDGSSSVVRTFAYASGPAYGFLLDQKNPEWRSHLTPSSDFGRLVAAAYKIEIPNRPSMVARRAFLSYDGKRIGDEEAARFKERQTRLEDLRRQFSEDRALVLPLRKPQMEFDPNKLTTYGQIGTVYHGITLRDGWGTLVSTGDVLIDKTYTWAKIPFPKDLDLATRKSDSWSLDLNEGWTVTKSEESNDLSLVNIGPPSSE